ncbi:MAG: tripartite tricarboxylate transporter TctB family protein [Alphaproteobacteria bacterium]|nr:tripartite tricarboxylate transporter TctB family protein [Alphaproteobacteria bacterium]
MRKDLFASVGLLGIAAAYYLASLDIPTSTLEDEVGPRGLPTVLTVLLVVLALALGARALLLAPKAKPAANDNEDAEAPWPRAIGMLALGAFYIMASTIVGYAPALFMLLLAVIFYEGMRPSWRVFVVAAGGAAFFYLLFDIVLGVRQPEGLLF